MPVISRKLIRTQQHPWVTKNGEDPLLSAEENCAQLVEPPTETEMDHAITGNMGGVVVVMKAVRKFKELLSRKRPHEGFLGRESRMVAPPHSVHNLSRSVDTHERRPVEGILAVEGLHRDMDVDQAVEDTAVDIDVLTMSPEPRGRSQHQSAESGEHTDLQQSHHDSTHASPRNLHENPQEHQERISSLAKSRTFPLDDHAKGHAHDPLTDTLFLSIGPSAEVPIESDDTVHPVVSESPGAVDGNIYEQAYQEEMQRILDDRGKSAALHLTRRVDHVESIRAHPNILSSSLERIRGPAQRAQHILADKMRGGASGGFAALVKQARAGVGAMSGDHNPTAHGGENALPKGTIDDEDHIPTNEESPGGVDGPPLSSRGASRPSVPRTETPTLPGSFPSASTAT